MTEIDDTTPPPVNVSGDCPTPECHIERCIKAEIAKALNREPANYASQTDDPESTCKSGAHVFCALIDGVAATQKGDAKIGACGVRPDTVTARIQIVVKVFGCNGDGCEADRLMNNIRFIFLSSKFARMYKAKRTGLERLSDKKSGYELRGEVFTLKYTDTPKLIEHPGK